jgi:hypothetical protein
MDLTRVSLVLAVSTAWATIFLGALPASALRRYSREVLRAAGAWVVVALCSPPAILHWHLIFAFLCLLAWRHIRHDRALTGKVWMAIASGLGISLGVVFLIQAAPEICPLGLPSEKYFLLLASIYLGGAVTGLAYAACLLSDDEEAGGLSSGYARLLAGLAFFWIVVAAMELRLTPDRAPLFHAVDPRILLLPLILIAALSFLSLQAIRVGSRTRAWRISAVTAVLAFGTQLLARELLL